MLCGRILEAVVTATLTAVSMTLVEAERGYEIMAIALEQER